MPFGISRIFAIQDLAILERKGLGRPILVGKEDFYSWYYVVPDFGGVFECERSLNCF